MHLVIGLCVRYHLLKEETSLTRVEQYSDMKFWLELQFRLQASFSVFLRQFQHMSLAWNSKSSCLGNPIAIITDLQSPCHEKNFFRYVCQVIQT